MFVNLIMLFKGIIKSVVEILKNIIKSVIILMILKIIWQLFILINQT